MSVRTDPQVAVLDRFHCITYGMRWVIMVALHNSVPSVVITSLNNVHVSSALPLILFSAKCSSGNREHIGDHNAG